MEKVTFTITKEEVQGYSDTVLSDDQLTLILEAIESDEGLWEDIKKSIVSSMNYIVNK